MEQGLSFDKLVEIKTSIERGAQRDPGGDQSPPTKGVARRADVPPSSECSDGQGVAERREGGVPAESINRKYSSS